MAIKWQIAIYSLDKGISYDDALAKFNRIEEKLGKEVKVQKFKEWFAKSGHKLIKE